MTYVPPAGLSQSRDRNTQSQAPILKPGLFTAKVIYVNVSKNLVDIVLNNSEIRREVPVAFPSMGTKAGQSYLQAISKSVQKLGDSGRPYDDYVDDRDRSVFAVVGFFEENPNFAVVLGFITPKTTQLLFDRQGFALDRHESDLYSMIENGPLSSYDSSTDTLMPEFEWYHPSGFFVKVGIDGDHEDLTGQDEQGLWRVRGTPNANTPMRSAGPDTTDYRTVTVKHPSGTGVTLDTNFNIQTGPGGQAQVNGCEILTECSELNVHSVIPIFDRLGHALVDTYGNPVLTSGG